MTTHFIHRVQHSATRGYPVLVGVVALLASIRAFEAFPGWERLLTGVAVALAIATPVFLLGVAAMHAMLFTEVSR